MEIIEEKDLTLKNISDENVSITYRDYEVYFKENLIEVKRVIRNSDEVGEMEDNFEIESKIDLTEEDEEVISNFCLSQDKD